MFQIDKKTGATKLWIPVISKKQVMETDVINRGIFTVNEDGETFEYYSLK